MKLKPIQFVLAGAIFGFTMNSLYHYSANANEIASSSPSLFSECTMNKEAKCPLLLLIGFDSGHVINADVFSISEGICLRLTLYLKAKLTV